MLYFKDKALRMLNASCAAVSAAHRTESCRQLYGGTAMQLSGLARGCLPCLSALRPAISCTSLCLMA
jgi:hypothetical protein